ncbi:hypothetical protein KA344_07915 [bacterium]|nr:hypothetical protein [bacterium]
MKLSTGFLAALTLSVMIGLTGRAQASPAKTPAKVYSSEVRDRQATCLMRLSDNNFTPEQVEFLSSLGRFTEAYQAACQGE